MHLGVTSHVFSLQSLHLELSDILGNNEILYPFMQFMKSEASVNVLQFYLSVGQFIIKTPVGLRMCCAFSNSGQGRLVAAALTI